jgi:hypothetical protein
MVHTSVTTAASSFIVGMPHPATGQVLACLSLGVLKAHEAAKTRKMRYQYHIGKKLHNSSRQH